MLSGDMPGLRFEDLRGGMEATPLSLFKELLLDTSISDSHFQSVYDAEASVAATKIQFSVTRKAYRHTFPNCPIIVRLFD